MKYIAYVRKSTEGEERQALSIQAQIRKIKEQFSNLNIIEILEDFAIKAKARNINIKLISERGIIDNPPSYIEFFKLLPITK